MLDTQYLILEKMPMGALEWHLTALETLERHPEPLQYVKVKWKLGVTIETAP